MQVKNIQVSFPFLSMLALVFITLKLVGTISWSWWWVLAPIWAPFALVFAIGGGLLVLSGVVMGLFWLIGKLSK